MIVLDGTTGITTPTTDSTAEHVTSVTGFKNRIINGGMVIDQRNAGASVTPSSVTQYCIDRFIYVGTQVSKLTLQQVSDAPAGFTFSHKLTVASSATPSASDQFRYCQPIEGFNTADLGWGTANAQPITISFRAKVSLAGTYSVAVWNGANGRSYVSTVALTTSWATYSITIAGDTTGTWATGNTVGIELLFDLGAGSTWTTSTTNAWQGANYFKATGSVSLISNAGATFYITGVQLEKGSVATSFDYRPYGTEFQLCQRYYELSGYTLSGTNAWTPANIIFYVTKRATPTITEITQLENSNFTSPAFNNITTSFAKVYASPTSAANCYRTFTISIAAEL